MSSAPSLVLFVSGALCAGFAIAALFFLRFFVRTRDVFFAAFAVAFALMAGNQAVAGVSHAGAGEDPRAYLLRLAAFVVIIVAVLGKNTPTKPPVT